MRFGQAGSPGPAPKGRGFLGSCRIAAHLHKATLPTSPPQLCSNSASLPGTPWGWHSLRFSLKRDSLLWEILPEHALLIHPLLIFLGSSLWPEERLYLHHPSSSPYTVKAGPGPNPSHSHCTVLSAWMASLKTGENSVIWVPILYLNPKRTVAAIHQRQKHRWRVGGRIAQCSAMLGDKLCSNLLCLSSAHRVMPRVIFSMPKFEKSKLQSHGR